MIYSLTKQKYKVGCNRGKAIFKKEGILDIINSISEWDQIRLPEAQKVTAKVDLEEYDDEGNATGNMIQEDVDFEIEDPQFLVNQGGKLVPGNTIIVGGQVIALDGPDAIVLVVSETGGYGALKRVWEEVIEPEYELTWKSDQPNDITWTELETWSEEFDTKFPIPYFLYRIWKDRFVAGRNLKSLGEHSVAIKVSMITSFGLLVEMVFTDWEVWINSEDFDVETEFDKETIISSVAEAISWFIEEYPRVSNPIEPNPSLDSKIEFYKRVWRISHEEGDVKKVQIP